LEAFMAMLMLGLGREGSGFFGGRMQRTKLVARGGSVELQAFGGYIGAIEARR
jgi:hypothetical protein